LILTRRRGADTAHTQMGRPTYATPTREYTHILLLIKSLTLGKTKFASNLARRRRKNHGFEPHIGKVFSCSVSSFLLAAFCPLFSSFCSARGVVSASGSLHFFGKSLPFTHLYFLLPHASCTPDLSDFFGAPTRVLFIPRSGTPASASGAKV
jgi:hypothetical protein